MHIVHAVSSLFQCYYHLGKLKELYIPSPTKKMKCGETKRKTKIVWWEIVSLKQLVQNVIVTFYPKLSEFQTKIGVVIGPIKSTTPILCSGAHKHANNTYGLSAKFWRQWTAIVMRVVKWQMVCEAWSWKIDYHIKGQRQESVTEETHDNRFIITYFIILMVL